MKITQINVATVAVALILPAAAFAQSTGAGTSGNPSATDIRPAGQGATAVTTGTSTSAASALVHPNDSDARQQSTGNGIPVTTGSGVTAPATTTPPH